MIQIMKTESISIIASILQKEDVEKHIKDQLMQVLRIENEESASKQRKFNLWDCVDKSGMRPVMSCIFHDGGFKVASEGHYLVAVKDEYPETFEGKCLRKDGEFVDGVYPCWKSLCRLERFNSFSDVFNLDRARDIVKEFRTDKKTKIYIGFFVKMFDRYILAEHFEMMTRFASMYHDEVKVFRHSEEYVIPLMLSHVDDLFLVMPRRKPDSDTIKVYEY